MYIVVFNSYWKELGVHIMKKSITNTLQQLKCGIKRSRTRAASFLLILKAHSPMANGVLIDSITTIKNAFMTHYHHSKGPSKFDHSNVKHFWHIWTTLIMTYMTKKQSLHSLQCYIQNKVYLIQCYPAGNFLIQWSHNLHA